MTAYVLNHIKRQSYILTLSMLGHATQILFSIQCLLSTSVKNTDIFEDESRDSTLFRVYVSN